LSGWFAGVTVGGQDGGINGFDGFLDLGV